MIPDVKVDKNDKQVLFKAKTNTRIIRNHFLHQSCKMLSSVTLVDPLNACTQTM